MRAIYFDPSALSTPEDIAWWKRYAERATTATDNAISAWETWLDDWRHHKGTMEFSHKFQQDIWKDLKRWLYNNVFYRKCAYCESTLELDRYLGDAEHFRPKGRVTQRANETSREQVRVRLDDGRELEHPGYFWLAYDWRNLIPACSGCNSGSAKVDQFPAAECIVMVRLRPEELSTLAAQPRPSSRFPGYFYLSPADLDHRERPLLLNPLNPPSQRDPRDHLRFGIDGSVVAVDASKLGRHSIEVLKLDRETLRVRRQRAQENAHRKYYGNRVDPQSIRRMEEDLEDYHVGREEYSAAVIDYLDAIQQEYYRRFRAMSRRKYHPIVNQTSSAAPQTIGIALKEPETLRASTTD